MKKRMLSGALILSAFTTHCDDHDWKYHNKPHETDYRACARKTAIPISAGTSTVAGVACGTGNYGAGVPFGLLSAGLISTAHYTENRYHRITTAGIIVMNSLFFLFGFFLGLLAKSIANTGVKKIS